MNIDELVELVEFLVKARKTLVKARKTLVKARKTTYASSSLSTRIEEETINNQTVKVKIYEFKEGRLNYIYKVYKDEKYPETLAKYQKSGDTSEYDCSVTFSKYQKFIGKEKILKKERKHETLIWQMENHTKIFNKSAADHKKRNASLRKFLLKIDKDNIFGPNHFKDDDFTLSNTVCGNNNDFEQIIIMNYKDKLDSFTESFGGFIIKQKK